VRKRSAQILNVAGVVGEPGEGVQDYRALLCSVLRSKERKIGKSQIVWKGPVSEKNYPLLGGVKKEDRMAASRVDMVEKIPNVMGQFLQPGLKIFREGEGRGGRTCNRRWKGGR